MLNRSLLLLLLLFLASLCVHSQCTPDLSCLPAGANSGYCPNHELDTGTVGVAYSQIVSIKVPANGADFGQPLTTIQHIDIVSVDSLAPGLTYTCNPPNCKFPGNSNGCILVSGTPTVAWDHKMTVHAMAYVKIFFVNTTQPYTLTNFYSVVENPAGINELGLQQLGMAQNNPNPFGTETIISFNSPDGEELELKVFNMLGASVYKQKLQPQKGNNEIRFSAENLSPGSYIYSIGNDKYSAIKKMMISRQ
jgi:hypothetical protein